MNENEIKEEIYKCSKCALCQSVCPIFIALKNEMYLPRGRFNVLNYTEKPSKKFIDNLDICLNCSECKNFCPSNINSAEIFTSLKNKYYKPLIPFWLKYKFILFFYSLLFRLKTNALQPPSLPSPLKGEGLGGGNFHNRQNNNVVYFQGCFNRYINNSDKNSAIKLLEQNGYNVVKILDNCCGMPFISDGNLKKFDNNLLKIKKSIPDNIQYIVTSCDSCYNNLSKIFDDKLVQIDKLIKFSKMTDNTFYYKPVTREEYNGLLPVINKKGVCTLSENFFFIKHPCLTKKIKDKIFYKKNELEGKTIVTSCNLTKWGLENMCKVNKIKSRIYSMSEYENI